jgi:hypothetical protein
LIYIFFSFLFFFFLIIIIPIIAIISIIAIVTIIYKKFPYKLRMYSDKVAAQYMLVDLTDWNSAILSQSHATIHIKSKKMDGLTGILRKRFSQNWKCHFAKWVI